MTKMPALNEVAVRKARPFSRDHRGSVVDLIGDQAIRRLIFVVSKKGSVRGNHFHRKAGHFVYIVEGRIRLVVRAEKKVRRHNLAAGTVVWIPPLVEHAFYAVTDSKALEYSDGPYSPDDAFPAREPLPPRG
jgi:quercetin dioxygenase-like cupin family protein